MLAGVINVLGFVVKLLYKCDHFSGNAAVRHRLVDVASGPLVTPSQALVWSRVQGEANSGFSACLFLESGALCGADQGADSLKVCMCANERIRCAPSPCICKLGEHIHQWLEMSEQMVTDATC